MLYISSLSVFSYEKIKISLYDAASVQYIIHIWIYHWLFNNIWYLKGVLDFWSLWLWYILATILLNFHLIIFRLDPLSQIHSLHLIHPKY